METGTIFIIAIIVTIAVLINIYDSKNGKSTNEEEMKEDLKKFITDMKTYVKYCVSEPISTEEIRHTSKLPIEKIIFVKRSILYIEYLEDDIQKLLLKFVPLLAYYREDVPEDGYLSLFDKILQDNNSIERFDNFSQKSLDILTHDLENSEDKNNKEDVLSDEGQKILDELSNEIYFPNDLLIECQNDSKEILKLLKSRIHNN